MKILLLWTKALQQGHQNHGLCGMLTGARVGLPTSRYLSWRPAALTLAGDVTTTGPCRLRPHSQVNRAWHKSNPHRHWTPPPSWRADHPQTLPQGQRRTNLGGQTLHGQERILPSEESTCPHRPTGTTEDRSWLQRWTDSPNAGPQRHNTDLERPYLCPPPLLLSTTHLGLQCTELSAAVRQATTFAKHHPQACNSRPRRRHHTQTGHRVSQSAPKHKPHATFFLHPSALPPLGPSRPRHHGKLPKRVGTLRDPHSTRNYTYKHLRAPGDITASQGRSWPSRRAWVVTVRVLPEAHHSP